jgi:hypothetical protein
LVPVVAVTPLAVTLVALARLYVDITLTVGPSGLPKIAAVDPLRGLTPFLTKYLPVRTLDPLLLPAGVHLRHSLLLAFRTTILPLRLGLLPASLAFDTLLLTSILQLLLPHLLHLPAACFAFCALLLSAILLGLPRLTLLRLLAASVHPVHLLLSAGFLLLTHLLHHLLALLAEIALLLLLRPRLLLAHLAAPTAPLLSLRWALLALRRSGLTDLLTAASSAPTLLLHGWSATPAITAAVSTTSAAALTLRERIRVSSGGDRQHGERGQIETF